MTKKKQTNQAKDSTKNLQNQEKQPTNTQENTEKLDSLKSLNSMLLKETVERRQQMESLERERHVLEAKLGDSALEKKALGVKCESLVVENSVLSEFLRAQVREKAEQVRKGIEGVMREKEVVEGESEGRGVRIGELEEEVGRLRGVVEELRKDEAGLRGMVRELERKCEEGVEREGGLGKVIEGLSEERDGKVRELRVVDEERVEVLAELDRVKVELSEAVRRVSELVEERNVVEKLKGVKECEVFELQTEVCSLRDVISKMQVSCKSQMEKNDQLAEEVCQFRDLVGRITVERDDARKGYDEEKKSGTELRSVVVKMEKKINDAVKELEMVKSEREKLAKIIMGNDIRFEKLVGEKDMLIKNLNEAELKIADLKCQIESAGLNSERTLMLLKKAAEFVGQSTATNGNGKKGGVSKGKLSGDLKLYQMELDAIKKAFTEKETKIENMTQQVELLQNSVADAQKKKSFWTIVSSVTTLFAAISVAFAATGH